MPSNANAIYASASPPTKVDHLAVLLLLCLSGNPVFLCGQRDELVVIASACLLMLGLLARRRFFVSGSALAVAGAFVAILLAQSLAFGFFPVTTVLGFCVKLFIAFATIAFVRDFPRVFVNVMTATAATGLAIYLLDSAAALAGVSLRSLIPMPMLAEPPQHYHMLVHNFTFSRGDLPYRNPGLFWEPAAFAGYLLMAMIFLAFARERFTHRGANLRLALLTAAVLTTFSTMGYLVLPLALLLQLRPAPNRARASGQTVLVYALVVLVVAGTVGIWKLKFVGAKISSQYAAATGGARGSELNRFGSAIFDWQYIQRRPLLGWGLHRSTRYALHGGETEVSMGQGNGLSDFVAKFGFIGLAVFLLAAWRGLGALTGPRYLRRAAALAAVLMILNGEAFLGLPAFLGLMFLREGGDPAARRLFLFAPGKPRIARPAWPQLVT